MKARYKLILGRRKDYPLLLELEVYKSRQCRVFVTTGITLESERQWDKSRQMVIKHTNAEQFNTYVKGMIDSVARAEQEAEDHEWPFTAEDIRMAARKETIFDGIMADSLFERYINEEKVRESTRKMHRSHIKSLYNYYESIEGDAILTIGNITHDFIVRYDKYLSAKVKTPARTAKHILLRNLLGKALKDGYIKVNPYDYFELPSAKSDSKPALTEEQLHTLEAIDRKLLKKNQIEEYVLDMFLFSCYTGLRYSDVSALRKTEITRDAKGLTIGKTTRKTGIDVVLPLYSLFDGKPQKIAERYMEEHEELEMLFPDTTPSFVSVNLKRLAELADIPINLTFHTSRHTCASMLAEKVDNPFVIMSILGHGDINTSMRYIHRSHKSAEKKLEGVNWNEGIEERPADEEIIKCAESVGEACRKKGLDGTLIRLAIGVASKNIDKTDLIETWINRMRKVDYSVEAFGDRLLMLVE